MYRLLCIIMLSINNKNRFFYTTIYKLQTMIKLKRLFKGKFISTENENMLVFEK